MNDGSGETTAADRGCRWCCRQSRHCRDARTLAECRTIRKTYGAPARMNETPMDGPAEDGTARRGTSPTQPPAKLRLAGKSGNDKSCCSSDGQSRGSESRCRYSRLRQLLACRLSRFLTRLGLAYFGAGAVAAALGGAAGVAGAGGASAFQVSRMYSHFPSFLRETE